MLFEEFKIGLRFHCGEKLYLCTDVRTRIVAAIRIDRVETSIVAANGGMSEEALPFDVAEQARWFSGPPYAVSEIVFDESDFAACKLASDR